MFEVSVEKQQLINLGNLTWFFSTHGLRAVLPNDPVLKTAIEQALKTRFTHLDTTAGLGGNLEKGGWSFIDAAGHYTHNNKYAVCAYIDSKAAFILAEQGVKGKAFDEIRANSPSKAEAIKAEKRWAGEFALPTR